MSSENIKLPLDREAIKMCIPHRAPLLLVDEVTDFSKGKYIHANKAITPEEPVFIGHFPSNPIWPGVYMIEGLAQCSAIMLQLTKEKPTEVCLLLEVESSRFKIPVLPGDRLEYKVSLIKNKGDFYWFEGQATTKKGLAAHASFCAKYV